MGAALDEARAALATDDVPIGAVVLSPARAVIGAGRNVREADGDPTGHAEVVAIRAAAAALGSWRLDRCTLVVTLEPCTMCAGAAVLARAGAGGLRRLRPEGRRGGQPVGRGPRPAAQPPPRGGQRRTGRGVDVPAR